MNRLIALVCILIAVLSLMGCSQVPSAVAPVVFYYPRLEFGVGEPDSVISTEIREGFGLLLNEKLELYLAGPQENALVNPFPEGTQLVSISVDEDTVHVKLTDSFASLSGIELTVACMCLTKTCLDMTEARYVEISSETALINGIPAVIMDGTAALVDDGERYAETTPQN